jgi:hypothetical protein
LGGTIRAAPSSSSSIIASVSEVDLPIVGVSVDGEYFLVNYNEQRGWINPIFGTTQDDISSVPVIYAVLRIGIMGGTLRAVPSSDGSLIASLSEVDLPILGINRDGDYFLVDYNGTRGWINPTFGEVQGDISRVPVVENASLC